VTEPPLAGFRFRSRIMSIFRSINLGILALGVSCSDSLTPFPEVSLRTEAAPSILSNGDELTMRSILQNHTGETVEVGAACGPPTLFELRPSSGDVVHPIPLDGAFTCPHLDYHTLQPFETDTVTIRWRVTGLDAGQWQLRSGFRRGLGLERLTEPVVITVQ
jgi:hypothetical protein